MYASILADDITRHLSDAGHPPPHRDNEGVRRGGPRARQSGPEMVHVRYEGGRLRAKEKLETCAAALRAHGYLADVRWKKNAWQVIVTRTAQ